MKHLIAILCVVQMWSFSNDLVIPDINSIYSRSNDDCLHVYSFNDKEGENQIEVVEPEPEEHVQEAMTFFKWEF